MKVSIIVPIFKVEQFIYQCVESITSQTYKDIEIILVDDGSTDNCPTICDDMALSDRRIKVIHKSNGGLSDARNFGLSAASGDYILFVDGDDFWLHNDDLEKLMSNAYKYPNVDFIGFNSSYYYPSSNLYIPWPDYSPSLGRPMKNSEALIKLSQTSAFVMSACMKLIKRQFLIDNELYFIKGQLSEDIPWFVNVLDCCNECMFVNLNIYAYRQGVSGSITHNIGLRNINSLIDIVETELQKLEKRNFSKEAKDCLLSFLAYEYSIILGYLIYLDKEVAEEKYQYLKQYAWLLKYTQDPKVKKVSLAYGILGLRLTTKLLQYRIKRMYNKNG